MQKLIKKTLALAFSFAILMTPILSGLETASAALSESMLETARQHQAEWEASGISNYDYEYELSLNGESLGVIYVRDGATNTEGRGEITQYQMTIDEIFEEIFTNEGTDSLKFGIVDVSSDENLNFVPNRIKHGDDVFEITSFTVERSLFGKLKNYIAQIWNYCVFWK